MDIVTRRRHWTWKWKWNSPAKSVDMSSNEVFIIIIIIIKFCWQHRFLWFSRTTLPIIHCPWQGLQTTYNILYRVDISQSLLVGQHWYVHRRTLLMSSFLLLQQCPLPHILFIILAWFLRWKISGHIAAVLSGAASKICSKQHVTFLGSYHLTFSPCVLLVSM